ncbi:MAG: hypothetical protein IJ236_01585, partial [Oscillospiraceae bacterium]|nr:hypothetical protein [Oscillospiraceae bacterium]
SVFPQRFSISALFLSNSSTTPDPTTTQPSTANFFMMINPPYLLLALFISFIFAFYLLVIL